MPDIDTDTFAKLTPITAKSRIALSSGYMDVVWDERSNKYYSMEDSMAPDIEVHAIAFPGLAQLEDDEDECWNRDTPPVSDPDRDSQPDLETHKIYHGHVKFSTSALHVWERWNVGKGARPLLEPPQIVLCDHADKVHGRHLIFSLGSDNMLLVRPANNRITDLEVNGIPVLTSYLLDQRTSIISFAGLDFELEYTDHHNSSGFKAEILAFERKTKKAVPADTIPPTVEGHQTEAGFGDWTFSKWLAAGASGPLYLATDRSGLTRVTKIYKRTAFNINELDTRLSVFKEIDNLVKEQQYDGLIRHVDTYPPESEAQPIGTNIFVVVEPNIDCTFTTLVKQGVMSPKQLVPLLRQALQHVLFLHSHGYIHRAIKPDNMGLSGSKVVLLGVDSAVRCLVGNTVPAEIDGPGSHRYTAPEYWKVSYDHTVDIWSLGIVFYQLLTGEHPFDLDEDFWQLKINDNRLEALGTIWWSQYRKVISVLGKRGDAFGELLTQMISQPFAAPNVKARITTAEALEHEVFVDVDDVDDTVDDEGAKGYHGDSKVTSQLAPTQSQALVTIGYDQHGITSDCDDDTDYGTGETFEDLHGVEEDDESIKFDGVNLIDFQRGRVEF